MNPITASPWMWEIIGKSGKKLWNHWEKDGGQSGENRTKLFFRADESL